jgi:hypothetical protein
VKPASVSLRSCALIVLLAGAVNSYAGVYVKNPDDPRYLAEQKKIRQEHVDAETQYANDKLRCKGDKYCLTTAGTTFQAALNQVYIHTNNNNGTHQKAIIDFRRASESKRVTGTTPQDKAENLRHFNAETTFQKEVVDADTQYANNKILCDTDFQSVAPSNDSYCMKQAASKYADAQLQIQIQRNTEDGTHAKNLIANAPSDKE